VTISRPKRRYNTTPQRRAQIPRAPGSQAERVRHSPIVPTFGAHSTVTLPVTFPEPIVYSGILPGYTDSAAHTVTAVSVTSPTTATLTFSGTVTTPVTIPFEDRAFRNMSGGYVQPGTYAIT